MMKRILWFILAAALVLAIAGCGSPTPKPPCPAEIALGSV